MKSKLPIAYAILAALCYGVSVPFAKLIQAELPPALIASLLYLGAGLGMSVVHMCRHNKNKEAKLTKADLPYTIAMILLDIAAPILLMSGLAMTTAATASLLGNFEIVATSVIALIIFKEAVGRRMWFAIALITFSSILLSVENFSEIAISPGALLVLAACVCWGIENNCTTKLSLSDPLQIVIVKGFGAGTGALIIVAIGGAGNVQWIFILATLLLGFVAFGLSIYFYILAQRHIGAARTSAYYAFAPFIGVALSLAIFKELPTVSFVAALAVMIAGAYFAASENHKHEHQHDGIEHEHRHRHDDGHHDHEHEHSPAFVGEHSHIHLHEIKMHLHPHTPDSHHSHRH